MSDERFDDAIREALLADDPGTVPTRLRTRMAMIPDEAAGQSAASPWRERFARYAVPMGVLAAAAIIVVVFGGIALRGPQVASVMPSLPIASPSAEPSAVPSAAPSDTPVGSDQPSAPPSPSATPAQSPVPTATAQPSGGTTGPVAIDKAKVVALTEGTFAIKGDLAYHFGRSDTVSDPLIGSIGLADSTKGGMLVRLQNGHDISAYAVTDKGVVWLETWYTDAAIDCTNQVPCSPHGGQPVSWKLNVTTADGKTTKLDSGVVSRLSVEGEGSTPLPPEIAAQGNRVAYAVPRTVSGQPQASRIIVRSLTDGSVIRTIDTSGYVGQVGIFGETVIYRRAVDTSGPSDPSNAYLNIAVDDAAKPQTIDGNVAQASIGDGGTGGPVRIAWTPGYGSTPGLRWAALANLQIHVVDAISDAQTSFDPVIVGDGYAWLGYLDHGDGSSDLQVQAWRPGWAAARAVPDLSSPERLFSSDGWLLSSGGDITVLKDLGAPGNAVAAIRAVDLFGN